MRLAAALGSCASCSACWRAGAALPPSCSVPLGPVRGQLGQLPTPPGVALDPVSQRPPLLHRPRPAWRRRERQPVQLLGRRRGSVPHAPATALRSKGGVLRIDGHHRVDARLPAGWPRPRAFVPTAVFDEAYPGRTCWPRGRRKRWRPVTTAAATCPGLWSSAPRGHVTAPIRGTLGASRPLRSGSNARVCGLGSGGG